MKIILFAMLAGIVLFPLPGESSRPVEVTLTGCVLGNTFYSIKTDRAYPIRFSSPLDLAPYEGKTVSIRGWLSPGDRFSPLERTSPQVIKDTCDAEARKAINQLYSVQYRIDALKAAKNGNFNDAFLLINKALELDRTDCDTYTDRAHIHCMRNDFEAVARDVAIIKNGACANPKKANFLLLEDLGKLLESKGKKQEALEVYRIALDACVSYSTGICRETIEKDIQNLLRR